MTMTQYTIYQDKGIDTNEFGYYMLDYGKAIHGLVWNSEFGAMDEDDVEESLKTNDEFVLAAKESGYDDSFEELSAIEVYNRLTGLCLDEDVFMDFEEQCNEDLKVFYNNFKNQADEIRKHLEEDERITILEDDCRDKIDVDYEVEFDDVIFNEVESFLKGTNVFTASKNTEAVLSEYAEKKFNTPLFKAVHSNVGSLEVEIEEV